MDNQDTETAPCKKRLPIKVLVVVLALMTLVIVPLIMITGAFWGCHGDMRGEQHCHQLCLTNDQSHCAEPSELFGDYSPGHIH